MPASERNCQSRRTLQSRRFSAPFERHAVCLEPETLVPQACCIGVVQDEVDEVFPYLRQQEGQVGDSRGLNLRASGQLDGLGLQNRSTHVVCLYASICLRW